MRILVAFVTAAAVLAAAAGPAPASFSGRDGLIVFSSNRSENLHAQVFSISPDGSARTRLTNGLEQYIRALPSPDGTKLALHRSSPGPQVLVANADGSGARNVTADFTWTGRPVWSPDGTRLAVPGAAPEGFGLYVVGVADGTRTLVAPGAADPAWSPDGARLAYRDEDSQRLVIGRADGGGAVVRETGARVDASVRWAVDGTIYFSSYTGDGYDVFALDPDAGPARRITRGWQAYPSPDGRRLAVVRDLNMPSALAIVSADGTSAVEITRALGDDEVSWSPDGARVAFVHWTPGKILHQQVAVSSAARPEIRAATNEPYGTRVVAPAWAAGGARIYFVGERESNDYELYAMRPDGSGVRPLTNNTADDGAPAWSPDGRRLTFARSLGGAHGLYVMNADGTRARRLAANAFDPSWSPEAAEILFTRASTLFTIAATGGTPRALVRGTNGVHEPSGRQIAFVRDGDLYVARRDGKAARRLFDAHGIARFFDVPVYAPGVADLEWSPDGKTILVTVAYALGRHEDDVGLFRVRADGSGVTALATRGVQGSAPATAPSGATYVVSAYHLFLGGLGGRDLTPDEPGLAIAPAWQPLCTRQGGARADSIRSGGGGDVVCGLGGNDRIVDRGGSDRLYGHEGDDVIFVRDGRYDLVGCGRGRDVVVADGADLVGRDCERVTRR